MDDENNNLYIGVPEFFKGRSVFITGFTGTVGKITVEKLLYSCPGIDKIYVLVRPKKGQTAQQRVQETLKSRAFIRLHKIYPDGFESKVVGIEGDLLQDRLGLSPEDEELLRKQVSIIIHGAASVRFDDPINVAFNNNTLGTKRIIDLALTMYHLICLTYISTAYCNCDHRYIEEKIYPANEDWRRAQQVFEKIDQATLQVLQEKYIDKKPNTYTYTKSLAEQVISDYSDKLPVVIVRSSVVIPADKEPVPGWADNLIAANGLSIGVVMGFVRVMWADKECDVNIIPSDVLVNSIILATWKKALTDKQKNPQDSVTVINSCCDQSDTIKVKFNYEYNIELLQSLKNDGIYFINIICCFSELSFRINNLYRHVLPSYIIDLFLVLSNKDPMLVKARRKLFSAIMVVKTFSFRSWLFQTDNFKELLHNLSNEDKESFGWDFAKIDTLSKRHLIVDEFKKTALKPFFDDLAKTRKRLRMLYIVDRSSVYLTFSLLAFILYYFNIPHLLLFTFISLFTFP